MSLAAQITLLAQAVAADVKTLTAHQGDLSTLNTTAKDSIVHAINEIKAALTSAGVHINDSAAAGDTTETYSADKILSLLTAAQAAVKSDILGGADPAYDTLKELQTALQNDETAAASLSTAVGNRVRFDAAQTLTAEQKAFAIANIGAISATDVGDVTTDFVAAYNTAKASA